MATGTTGLDGAELKRSIKGRLREVKRELESVRELLAEQERLEAALARLERAESSVASAGRGRSRGSRGHGRGSHPPRGQSRELVLSFMAELGRPATATEVSNATGLKRSSVATLLSRLVRSGELEKRERGYAVAGSDAVSPD